MHKCYSRSRGASDPEGTWFTPCASRRCTVRMQLVEWQGEWYYPPTAILVYGPHSDAPTVLHSWKCAQNYTAAQVRKERP